MPDRLIRRSPTGQGSIPRVENDAWQVVGADPAEDLAAMPAGPVLVPLALWKSKREALGMRRDPLGVWLKPEDEPGEIAPDLDRFAVVAVHFPKFGDGRGYTTGALLRTRYGYRGELRAFGDIGRDHLIQLARCGFDAFRLADRYDPEAALASFDDLAVRYQGSVDDPAPHFRRRAAAGALR